MKLMILTYILSCGVATHSGYAWTLGKNVRRTKTQRKLIGNNNDLFLGDFYGNQNNELMGYGRLKIGNIEYEGDWMNGKLNYGLYRKPGFRYEGDFEMKPWNELCFIYKVEALHDQTVMYPQPHGQGILKTKTYHYQGDFHHGFKKGFGIKKENGYIYEGEWNHGMQNGKGKLINSKDDSTFEGYFKDGHATGWGKLVKNNSIFEGNFKGTYKRHGFGNLVFWNGQKKHQYLGFWSENKFMFGSYKNPNGRTYLGHFRARRTKTNHGRELISGIRLDPYPGNSIYQGHFRNGLLHGEGRRIWTNGALLNGYWENDDPKHGTLVCPNEYVNLNDSKFNVAEILMMCPDQDLTVNLLTFKIKLRRSIYIGTFKYSMPHGIGTRKYMDENIYQGEWYHGLKHGKGRFITHHKIYSGTFNKGQLQSYDDSFPDNEILFMHGLQKEYDWQNSNQTQ